jgi:hypothetical protein
MTEREAEDSWRLATVMAAGAGFRSNICSSLRRLGPRAALNWPQRLSARGSLPKRALDDQEPTKRKAVSISLRSVQ